MFKFTDSDSAQVWLKPNTVVAIEHVNNDIEHTVVINTTTGPFYFTPADEGDCRSFLFQLFKEMSEVYTYE